MKNFRKYFLFFIILANICFAQGSSLKIITGTGEKNIATYERKGVLFVSAVQLSDALGGGYFINSETAKVELKFPEYKIKYTGRNQFVIIIPRFEGEKKVFQLPISTLIGEGDVYLPLRYCLSHLEIATSKSITYSKENATLSIGGFAPEQAPITRRSAVNSDFDISGLAISAKANGTLISLKAKKNLGKLHFSIKDNVGYLFLYGLSVDPALASSVKVDGAVKSVRQKKVGANTQVEFPIAGEYKNYEAFQDPQTNDIYITIHSNMATGEDNSYKFDKEKWKFDVIVLDAGHGGKDAGAIGITGAKEKDINLAITLELGKLIESKMDSIKVVYTRDSDKFVELHERGKIANRNKGKLFISIHCNSLGGNKHSTRGFEVYLLRPGRTDEAIEIAQFENSVIKYEENPDIYKTLNDENFILVSMAHSSYMRYSEKFSDYLNTHWDKNVAIPSRGIKQAGFYVLVGASMPGVLVENGFLSNREDEKYLKSKKGQKEIAAAIYKAIEDYRDYYENSFADDTPINVN